MLPPEGSHVCNGKLLLPYEGHLGYAIGTKITNLVEDHPVIISIMLQFHWLSSFWQEDFRRFNQSEHIIGPGSHVEFPICTKITNLDLPMNISAKFGPNLFSSFREEDKNMKFTYGDDDDGCKVMTKAHLALWARWAKKEFFQMISIEKNTHKLYFKYKSYKFGFW